MKIVIGEQVSESLIEVENLAKLFEENKDTAEWRAVETLEVIKDTGYSWKVEDTEDDGPWSVFK